jgi:hypothetical protein
MIALLNEAALDDSRIAKCDSSLLFSPSSCLWSLAYMNVRWRLDGYRRLRWRPLFGASSGANHRVAINLTPPIAPTRL